MSLIQTARLQSLNPLPFLRELLTNPEKAATTISLESSAKYAIPIEGNAALQPADNPSSQANQRQLKQPMRRLPEIALASQCA